MMQIEKIDLRQATENDFIVLEKFCNQNYIELHSESLNVDLLKHRISDQRADSVIFVIELNSVAIGYLFVSRCNDPLSIYEYFLLSEQRGKGHGFDAIAKLMEITGSYALDVLPGAWRSAAGAM